MRHERDREGTSNPSQIRTPEKHRAGGRYHRIEHSASSDQSPVRRGIDADWLRVEESQMTRNPQTMKTIKHHASDAELPQVGRPSFQKLEKIFQEELAHMCRSPEKKPQVRKYSDSDEDIRNCAPLPTVQKACRAAPTFVKSPSIQTKKATDTSPVAATRTKSPSGVQKLSQKSYIARLIGSIENLLSSLYSQQAHKQKDYPKFESETRQLLTEGERLLEELGEDFYMTHYDACSRSIVRGKGRSLGPCSCVFKLQKDKDMIRILSNLRKALVTAGKKIDVPSLVLSKSRDSNKENKNYSSIPTKPSVDDFKIGVHSMCSGDSKIYEDLKSIDPVNKNIQDIERRLKQIQYQLAADQTPTTSNNTSQQASKHKHTQNRPKTGLRGGKSPSTTGSVSSRSKDTGHGAVRDRSVRPWDHGEEILLVDDAKSGEARTKPKLESRGSLQNSQRSNAKRTTYAGGKGQSPLSRVVVSPEVVTEAETTPQEPTSRFEVEHRKETTSNHPVIGKEEHDTENWNNRLLKDLIKQLAKRYWDVGYTENRMMIRKFRKDYILGGVEDDQIKTCVEYLEQRLRQAEQLEEQVGSVDGDPNLIRKIQNCVQNLIAAANIRLNPARKSDEEDEHQDKSRISFDTRGVDDSRMPQSRSRSRRASENLQRSKLTHASQPGIHRIQTQASQVASLGGAVVTACTAKTVKLAQRRSSDCTSPSISAACRSPTSFSPSHTNLASRPSKLSQGWVKSSQSMNNSAQQPNPVIQPATRSGSFNQQSSGVSGTTTTTGASTPSALKLVSADLLSVGYYNGDLCFHRLVRCGNKYQTRLVAGFRVHDGPVSCLEVGSLPLNRVGDFLSCLLFSTCNSVTNGGAVAVWDPNGPSLVRRLTGHTGQVTCLKAVDSLGVLMSGATDRKIAFWDLNADLSCIRVLELTGGAVSALDFCDEKSLLCVGQACGQVSLWNLTTKNGGVEAPSLQALVNAGNGIADVSITSALQGHILIVTEDDRFGMMATTNMQMIMPLTSPTLENPVKDYFIIETSDNDGQNHRVFDNCTVLIIDSQNRSHRVCLDLKHQWRSSSSIQKPTRFSRPNSSFRPRTQIMLDDQGISLISTDPTSGLLIIKELQIT